jgi:hypothetical protein
MRYVAGLTAIDLQLRAIFVRERDGGSNFADASSRTRRASFSVQTTFEFLIALE